MFWENWGRKCFRDLLTFSLGILVGILEIDFERVVEKYIFNGYLASNPARVHVTFSQCMNFNSLTFVWGTFYSSVKKRWKSSINSRTFFRGLLEKHKLYQTLHICTTYMAVNRTWRMMYGCMCVCECSAFYNVYLQFCKFYASFRRTVGQIAQKCKET